MSTSSSIDEMEEEVGSIENLSTLLSGRLDGEDIERMEQIIAMLELTSWVDKGTTSSIEPPENREEEEGIASSMEPPESREEEEGIASSMEPPESREEKEGIASSMEPPESREEVEGTASSIEPPESREEEEGATSSIEPPESREEEEGATCSMEPVPESRVMEAEMEVTEVKKVAMKEGSSQTEEIKQNEPKKEEKCGRKYVSTFVRWLPGNKGKKYFGEDQGYMKCIISSTLNIRRLFQLVELSIPPLLEQKFHNIDICELMTSDFQDHYQSVAAWFTAFSEAYGLQYLKILDEKLQQHLSFKTIPGVEVSHDKYPETEDAKVKRWQRDTDFLFTMSAQSRTVESAPTYYETAEKSANFLLERCIIIQLPWQSVLYHQWLIVALIEVLSFEKESLELRHWCLPVEIEPIAREMLFLLKKLKERIILGFVLLFKNVSLYPETNTKHPSWILDEVVLPSLSMLEVLASGKGSQMLNSIKKICWSESVPNHISSTQVYVPYEVYQIDKELHEYFESMYYHTFYWSQLAHMDTCGETDFKPNRPPLEPEYIIEKLNKQNPTVPENTDPYSSPKPKSLDENKLWKEVLEDEKSEHKLDGNKKVALTLATIKETIVDKGMLSLSAWQIINELMDSDKTKEALGGLDMFDIDKKLLHDLENAVILALMNRKCYADLVGSEFAVSVVVKLINFGYETLEQEQVIRLAHVVGKIVSDAPKATVPDDFKPMDIEDIRTCLDQSKKKLDREWLWSQFPSEWRKPVSLTERSIKPSCKFYELVKKYENRIGRIVFNTAQKCFDVFEKGGDIFPHWQTVQYVVPCYVALYSEFLERPNEKFSKTVLSNYMKLLHHIVQFYEKFYTTWFTVVAPRKKPPDPKLESVMFDMDAQIREIFLSAVHYKDLTNFVLNSHIGHMEPVSPELHRFQLLTEGFMEWPEPVVKISEKSNLHYVLRSWVLRVYSIYKDLYSICLKAWEYPLPGELKAPKDLADVYLADSIMQALETILYKVWANIEDIETVSKVANESHRLITNAKKSIYQLRFNVHMMITELDNNSVLIKMVLEILRYKLQVTYKYLKLFKKEMGTSQLQCMDYLPSQPPFLKTYSIQYLNNEFEPIEKKLMSLNIVIDQDCDTPSAGTSSSTNEITTVEKKKKSSKEESKKSVRPAKKCRNCPRTEERRGSFLACEKCQQQKYPDVNFFCSKSCKYAWWKAEHMAEHLEFELGIADFSHLNLHQGHKTGGKKGGKEGPPQ